MVAALVLAAGVAFGVHPAVVALAAVAAIEPRLVIAAAVAWGIVSAARRRAARPGPDDEAAFFRALAAELRSGSSLRAALGAASLRVPRIPLGRSVRLAAAGLPMSDVAEALEDGFPQNGVVAGAAFRLSDWSGARVADTFDRLADRATGAAELARERRTSTAQARLSAFIVGVAPLVFTGLVFATGHGGGFAAHGRVGWSVLAVGLMLEIAGLTVVAVLVGRSGR